MIRIPLGERFATIIDDADWEIVSPYTWAANPEYRGRYIYAIARSSRPRIRMHRLLLKAQPGEIVDHANGDTLDNRRANIRLCTTSENSRNRVGSRAGPKGITWNRRAGKWQAQIKCHDKSYYLGIFDTELDAAKAYDAAAIRLFGQFARTNYARAA